MGREQLLPFLGTQRRTKGSRPRQAYFAARSKHAPPAAFHCCWQIIALLPEGISAFISPKKMKRERISEETWAAKTSFSAGQNGGNLIHRSGLHASSARPAPAVSPVLHIVLDKQENHKNLP